MGAISNFLFEYGWAWLAAGLIGAPLAADAGRHLLEHHWGRPQ